MYIFWKTILFLGSNSILTPNSSNKPPNITQTTSSNVPSSQSVQLQMGQNSGNSLIPHSQSAYEMGQTMTHQHALHQQLQQRFASVNPNSGKFYIFHGTEMLFLESCPQSFQGLDSEISSDNFFTYHFHAWII